MKKCLVVVICICLLISLAGCGKRKESEKSDTQTLDTATVTTTTEEIPEVKIPKSEDIIFPREINISNISNISLVDNDKKAYVFVVDFQKMQTKLYCMEVEGNEFKNPIEISLPANYIITSLCAIPNSNGELFFNAIVEKNITLQEIAKYNFNTSVFKAIIKDNKLEVVGEIEQLKSKGILQMASVDEKESIYTYKKMGTNVNPSIVLFEKDEAGNYVESEVSKLSFFDYYTPRGVAISADGGTLVSAIPIEDNAQTSYRMNFLEKQGDSWSELKKVGKQVNSSLKDIFPLCISNDGTRVYYINSTTYLVSGNLSDSKIMSITIEEALMPFVEAAEDAQESQQYDKVEFPLEYRNKTSDSNKQGVYYEIFVRAFADSDGDGIGDLNGVTANLDYLKQLGIDGIWLMPITDSVSYHGYDVVNYSKINPAYGTEADLVNLLDEAHKLGIKVIMDFVVNHTSNLHPWFMAALDGDSQYRDYYRFVRPNDQEDYRASAKSPWNSEVWHIADKAYYYGIFYSGMPDLNYNNSQVRQEIKSAAQYWLKLGVDGFRLDAAMHIYGAFEFIQEENQTAKNIQWWNEFALACEEINSDVYLVGECWQGNQILADYAQPFDTIFDFAFVEDMMKAVNNEVAKDSEGNELAVRLQNILAAYNEAADNNFNDGIFAANHDQNRIMSQFNNVEKARLAANIYMTLSGNAFIYYGEELGMFGSGDDMYKRTSFKWGSEDTSDYSQYNSSWIEANDEKAVQINKDVQSLEEQINDKNSMYNYYKKLIGVRKDNVALMSGDFEAVQTANEAVMAYKRSCEEQTVYIYHNFSDKEVVLTKDSSLAVKEILFKNNASAVKGNNVILAPYSSIIFEIK